MLQIPKRGQKKTHASFKVVLPNLRHGCALWRQIAMQKADAAPMGQKKHHPCGVRTRSPATTRSPAKRNNWIAAMHLLKAKTICFTCNELPLLLRPRACNELKLLLRHRAVRKNTHAGEVRLLPSDHVQ